MKWYIDWLAMRGVNLFVPHAFYYSVDGDRKGERPPDVGPNNIWWKHYRKISDYTLRPTCICLSCSCSFCKRLLPKDSRHNNCLGSLRLFQKLFTQMLNPFYIISILSVTV